MFVLHDMEGCEHREVADALGVRTGTSKSQLHKARMRLRALACGRHRGQDDGHDDLSATFNPALPNWPTASCLRPSAQEIDAHLDECAACRGVLQGSRAPAARRGALGPITPPDHVWLQVAARRGLERPRRVAASPHASARARAPSGSAWRRRSCSSPSARTISCARFRPQMAAAGEQPCGNALRRSIAEELNLAMQHYDKAMAELEALAKSNSGVLDPQMAKTLRQNIQTIDPAIAESRTALAQNPGSETARESLFEALRRKVVVLQATVKLMNEMRKGNQAGAAEAAAVFSKKS